ncbi:anthranilate synthase component I family protein [Psychrobacter urativorans]|uniref:anthranilate synthase component I family protein n=1 Tax=Psychrobacter urativorans TaxID=45610 RepID=UPI0019184541|nr:anthranilate synthase component I family protein [Psychrobacter urativorans]
MIAPDNIKKVHPTKTPSVQNRWRFGGLPAAEFLPLLQRYLTMQDSRAQWQLVWLNNDGRPVIGLLPKVIWHVYFNDNSHSLIPITVPIYKIIKTCRDNNNSVTTAYMSYTDWQDALISYSKHYETVYNAPVSINSESIKPSYHHGLMGFIGYDITAFELSPAAEIQPVTQPFAAMGHYDIYLTPTDNEKYWALNIEITDTDDELDNPKLAALISYLDTLDNKLSAIDRANEPTDSLAPLILTAKWHKSDYQQAFAQAQCYLQQGDCYQINLTQAWQGSLVTSNNLNENATTITKLIDYLPDLHRNTQAPFAGYIGISTLENDSSKTDSSDNINFELLSCSPELFFTFIKASNTDGNTASHHIRTKPIKGTRPRGMNAEQDLTLMQQLTASDKDRAENVMIVDLLRNDLGKYAKTGSVKVPELFAIESFSNVHHMVSTITAKLKVDAHPLAVLFGSLPAGSITGTPKKRAVEIISELEADARGAYCGTMGYMNFDGSGQWNVLIRTLQAHISSSTTREVSLWAGGGITVASDCDDEYQECLDKVGNLLNVLRQADSIQQTFIETNWA